MEAICISIAQNMKVGRSNEAGVLYIGEPSCQIHIVSRSGECSRYAAAEDCNVIMAAIVTFQNDISRIVDEISVISLAAHQRINTRTPV